jgi:hypothetical protein
MWRLKKRKMKLQEVKEEEMYVLVAPDGNWQPMTLAPTFEMCVAVIKMLYKARMSESFHELVKVKGFVILPITVTVKQMGDEEAGFQWAKQKLGI